MALIKRPGRSPIDTAQAKALKAAQTHEAGLALIDAAHAQVKGVKSDLIAHADSKQELAAALISEANTLNAAANLLAVGQTDSQVREVFAPVK